MTKIRIILLAVFLVWPFSIFCGEKINISDSPGWESISPRITVDPDGYIHVVWVDKYSADRGDVFYSRANPDGTGWSEPLKLSSSGRVHKSSCSIDVDGSGRLYVLWSTSSSVRLRICTNGKWGSSIQLASGANKYWHTKIAVNPGGNIYTVWSTQYGRVYSKSKVNGVWESAEKISYGSKRSGSPDIAVGNNVVYACWHEKVGGPYRIMYSRRNPGLNASWSSRKKVYELSTDQSSPALEVDSYDDAHVVWTTYRGGPKEVRYSSWKGEKFSYPKSISRIKSIHYPSLCERNDDIFVCWQMGPTGNGVGIYYNILQYGEWSGESAVPQSGGATVGDVAVSPDGEGVYFVWNAKDDIYFNSLQGASPTTNIPPVARFSFSPHIGLFPLKVSCDASASYDSDGTIARYDWDFGDGGVGSGKKINYIYQSWGTFPITLSVVDDQGAIGIEVKEVEVLRLFQPLNIRHETFVDESLFFTRYVNEVYWERNPKNDEIAEIVYYRIYKKRKGEPNFAYRCIGEVDADVFTFRDKDIEEDDMYAYTVTSVDSEGHESPIIEGSAGALLNDNSNKKIWR